MWLNINPRDSEPIYLQIIRGVKTAAAKGVLQPGEKLPSVRELATELAVNHNTVAKAYQELERERVIEVIRGRGTFISLDSKPTNLDERLDEMRTSMRNWLVEAHHLGMTTKQFIDMVNEVVDDWTASREAVRHE
ncbi:GntR family transcriptional regulator [Alicyclobacillus dauci]|uniref:GntR family transcriptional regulator n=1 Tax=Alicyclobacillus dauci TaxID=1475485 RepID=A0ABY6YY16_9BACL|nr:GntR family transcriptional regulator [Alicyclobacillus dauci]WAH35461.1 GntR family transcriptional regulator [Alicyclobacillus dauci]